MKKHSENYSTLEHKSYLKPLLLTGGLLLTSTYFTHDALAAETHDSTPKSRVSDINKTTDTTVPEKKAETATSAINQQSPNNNITPTQTVPSQTTTTKTIEQSKPEGSQTLWDNPDGENYYRIPAIASTGDGHVVAVADYRYNDAWDLGHHRIDLLVKHSINNGESWGTETNITKEYTSKTIGYGDAALVADRNSNKLVILSAYGDKGYWHKVPEYVSTRKDPLRIARLVSNDGGYTFEKPQDITQKIYGLNDNWTRLFAASGRIMQSRYVKVGDYYRIYTSILEGQPDSNNNYVLYSDDLGENWNILGDTHSPVPKGDEAKIEELPNGNVVIFSRTAGGRIVNVFTYDKKDKRFATGTWERKPEKVTLGDGASTNGETLVVYAKNLKTNQYTYLLLQSLPTIDKSRKGVGIYYKALSVNDKTAKDIVRGWNPNDFYLIQKGESAYPTMTVLKKGEIGFLYEDKMFNLGYDIQYLNLNLKTITNGLYEMAYTGLGTKQIPFMIENAEQQNAKESVFKNESLQWLNMPKTIEKESVFKEKENNTITVSQTSFSKEKERKLHQGFKQNSNTIETNILKPDQKIEKANKLPNTGVETTRSILLGLLTLAIGFVFVKGRRRN
ncbi:LPXTG cell wall anchor domain-containing protein [Staphylococcus simulans]